MLASSRPVATQDKLPRSGSLCVATVTSDFLWSSSQLSPPQGRDQSHHVTVSLIRSENSAVFWTHVMIGLCARLLCYVTSAPRDQLHHVTVCLSLWRPLPLPLDKCATFPATINTVKHENINVIGLNMRRLLHATDVSRCYAGQATVREITDLGQT